MAATGNPKPGPTFDTPAGHRAVTGLESLDDWTPARLVHQVAAHLDGDGGSIESLTEDLELPVDQRRDVLFACPDHQELIIRAVPGRVGVERS